MIGLKIFKAQGARSLIFDAFPLIVWLRQDHACKADRAEGGFAGCFGETSRGTEKQPANPPG